MGGYSLSAPDGKARHVARREAVAQGEASVRRDPTGMTPSDRHEQSTGMHKRRLQGVLARGRERATAQTSPLASTRFSASRIEGSTHGLPSSVR